MSVHNYFTCDYCNPNRDFDADEGLAVTVGHERPERWFEIPQKGPNETVGHACPECVATNGEARRDIAERRDAALARLAGANLELASEDEGADDRDSG